MFTLQPLLFLSLLSSHLYPFLAFPSFLHYFFFPHFFSFILSPLCQLPRSALSASFKNLLIGSLSFSFSIFFLFVYWTFLYIQYFIVVRMDYRLWSPSNFRIIYMRFYYFSLPSILWPTDQRHQTLFSFSFIHFSFSSPFYFKHYPYFSIQFQFHLSSCKDALHSSVSFSLASSSNTCVLQTNIRMN